ncbi:MAG: Na+/H+ antiporter NhaA [Opitutaceae bacterium]|nr:Na+/H+ antiporter NhaA [Cytophagales bacterium]
MPNPILKSRKISKAFARISRPFLEFLQLQQASGYLLLLATLIALIWANSPFGDSFAHFWHTKIDLQIFSFTIEQFVNDGLMTIFFTVVGLEIKRELVQGTLSTREQAILPVVGAIGGMAFPAIIFLLFNYNTEAATGWAIPTATDIAFSLAIIQLLGNRVPLSLKVFLMALAVVDDLGAIIIIASVYSEQLNLLYFLYSAMLIVVLFGMNKWNIKNLFLYSSVGALLWYSLNATGIHPTISGVILALFVPLKSKNINGLHAEPPLEILLHKLNGFASLLIMPLFALCNSGVSVNVNAVNNLFSSLSLGIFFALLCGKSFGITLTVVSTSKMGLTKLPVGIKIYDLFLVNILAGIGFTMSIFVTNLAFTNQQMIDTSKLAIILASFTAGALGYTLIRLRK